MRRALWLACVLTACSVQPFPPKAHGQSPRYVVFDTHVRNVLAADWDKHANDPAILERAYCLTYQKDVWVIPEYVWRVVEIEPAQAVYATPHSIAYRCPEGANITSAHLHPFQTCVSDLDCVAGGAEAGQCFPSDTDVRSLVNAKQPFAVIICGRDALVFYLPPAPAATGQATP